MMVRSSPGALSKDAADSLVAVLPVPVVVIDPGDGAISFANPAFCALVGDVFGLPVDGPVFWNLFDPADRGLVRDAFARAGRAREIILEARILGSSRASFPVAIRAAAVLSERDDVALRHVVSLHDVSAWRDKADMLELCMSAGSVGWFRRNFADRTFDAGPITRAMRFLPQGEAPIPENDWFASILAEDFGEMFRKVTQSYLRGEPKATSEYRVIDPASGAVRHHDARLLFNYGTNGECDAAFGVLIDVTRQREAEALLRLSMEIGKVGTYRFDLGSGEIKTCDTTRRIAGLSPDAEMMSIDDWMDLILPEDMVRISASLVDGFARKVETFSLNYRMNNCANGGVRHVEVRSRVEYDNLGKPLSILGVVIDITEHREAEARLEHMAMHDALTGLPNRVLFRDRLSQALARARKGSRFAVLFIDLDRFKDVNDTLGHQIGDALLRAVAARIRGELGPLDTFARLGGDEFAVIHSNRDEPEAETALASRIVTCLGRPFEIGGHLVMVGGSVGIAIAPDDGLDSETLIQASDIALFQAKADGRGCWRFFAPEMAQRMKERRALEADLRHALDAGEFELFYQPIVDVPTCRVTGFEALIRWRHPTRGLIMPDAFIPLAEETGIIVPIGDWLYRRATADAASWADHLSVSVNISAVEFDDISLGQRIVAAVDAAGLAPNRLVLEITETVMLRDTQPIVQQLHWLRQQGMRIALDDFGIGYSALGYLQRFPFDKVKLDRIFVNDLIGSRHSKAIVSAVITLCAELGMVTTAEGVETESQLAVLRAKGCNEVQGYLFSRPCPAAQVSDLLRDLDQRAAQFLPESGHSISEK